MAPHQDGPRPDRIALRSMRFHGRHGVLPEERERGQTFVVDVALLLDLQPAGTSDNLLRTVDYRAVFEAVRQVVEGEPLHLIEAVAERIARSLFKLDSRIDGLEITVRKPEVPLPGDLDEAAVTIHRRR